MKLKDPMERKVWDVHLVALGSNDEPEQLTGQGVERFLDELDDRLRETGSRLVITEGFALNR